MTHRTLDKLWAEAVKRRSPACEACGSRYNVSAHHVIGRTHLGLRWDIRNGITLCQKHHTGASEFSAHQTPDKFLAWFKRYREEDFIYLESQKWELNFDLDLEEIADKLRH